MAAAEPIRNREHIRAMANYYRRRGQIRNYVLIVLGVYTALRIGDLLRLTWGDVLDSQTGGPRSHILLTESKTGKSKEVALNKHVVKALELYKSTLEDPSADGYLFQTRHKKKAPISRIQAYRLIRTAACAVRLAGRISCHSLRKTFGYHAWKAGHPLAVIMDIYNHSSFAVTRRYLGISRDDRDRVYLCMQLF